ASHGTAHMRACCSARSACRSARPYPSFPTLLASLSRLAKRVCQTPFLPRQITANNRRLVMDGLAYRIPEAAARIGVGRTKLLEEISAGRLRAVRVGRRVLVTERELRRYLADLEARESPVGA